MKVTRHIEFTAERINFRQSSTTKVTSSMSAFFNVSPMTGEALRIV